MTKRRVTKASKPKPESELKAGPKPEPEPELKAGPKPEPEPEPKPKALCVCCGRELGELRAGDHCLDCYFNKMNVGMKGQSFVPERMVLLAAMAFDSKLAVSWLNAGIMSEMRKTEPEKLAALVEQLKGMGK